jgi:hypothetical protein
LTLVLVLHAVLHAWAHILVAFYFSGRLRAFYTVGYPMVGISHGTHQVPRKVRHLHEKSHGLSVGVTEYHAGRQLASLWRKSVAMKSEHNL